MPRLLIEIESVRESAYDLKYYHKLQGAIYSAIKGTEYSRLHDIKGYKYFCFSNIFPAHDFKKGDAAHFMISSPNSMLLDTIRDALSEKEVLNVGEASFKIKSIKEIELNILNSLTATTATPIVLRIPRESFEKYGIKPRKNYNYVYWRKEHSFNAFLKQLEENLLKKYYQYYNPGSRASEERSTSAFLPLFQSFLFKKSTCNHIVIEGKEVKIIGSLWEFMFSGLSRAQRELLKFGIDAGFGELNSIGFGFMNIKR